MNSVQVLKLAAFSHNGKGGAEGIAPSALASHLLIERGTISILTNRMIERGWLARRPGENRRTFRLGLTPTGRQLLDKLAPLAVELADHTLAGIPSDQLRQMRANLELIEAGLRGYTPRRDMPRDRL